MLVGRRGLVFELSGRLHDDEGRAGDLSLTSEIRGLFRPARLPTALYVALIPHPPFINASGEILTKFCQNAGTIASPAQQGTPAR
jgi:hypothetical protein